MTNLVLIFVVNLCLRPFQILSLFRITLTDSFWPEFSKEEEEEEMS